MITRAYPENRAGLFSRDQTPEEKRASHARTRQEAEAAMESPLVRQAFTRMLDAGHFLHEAGRYRDARTVLLTAVECTLRLHFILLVGRPDAGDCGAGKYAEKLRSMGALDKATFKRFNVAIRASGPYDATYTRRLLRLATKLCHMTFSSADEAATVRL